jgi:hypothetical protein
LSGLARRPFRAAENAIHCEDGAATMTTSSLERVVSRQYPFHFSTDAAIQQAIMAMTAAAIHRGEVA